MEGFVVPIRCIDHDYMVIRVMDENFMKECVSC